MANRASRQFTTPLLIRGPDGVPVPLTRVPLEERGHFREEWFQKLLYDCPALMPIQEIEQVFAFPVAVARELPVGSGSLDILYVNERGFLTLVETKLWKNPEARREVVAQIINYATEMSRWSYQDLSEAVRKASKTTEKDPLVELFRSANDGDTAPAQQGKEDAEDNFDERAFVDQVSRNLRLGRCLLLIVGDGIHESLESMVEFLQETPQLRFTLALVEISLFREHPDSDDLLIVQPRIVARTQEVTRAIVELKGLEPEKIVVRFPVDEPEREARKRQRMSEEIYFEELSKAVEARVVKFVREVLDEASDHGLSVDWMQAGPVLKYEDESAGTFFNFGQLHVGGELQQTGRLAVRCFKLGLPPDIYRDYFDEMAKLIPGASRKPFKLIGQEYEWFGYGENDWLPLKNLVPIKEKWLMAIDKVIKRIGEALENR
jgi:hypothetical protein